MYRGGVCFNVAYCHILNHAVAVDEADRDGDGVINEEEFYRVMRKRENPLDEIDSDDDF